jgi:hypothetical protein
MINDQIGKQGTGCKPGWTWRRPFLRIDHMELHEIPIGGIKERDERFRTAVLPSETLNISVEKRGIMQPLQVVVRGEDWVLLSGWKRYWAAREAVLPSVPVLILDQPRDLDAFEGVLDENLAFRQLSLMEKANALKRLCDLGRSEEEVVRTWLPRLGIPGTGRWLEIYLQMAAWSGEIQKAAQGAGLSLSALELLGKLPEDVQRSVLPLLHPLSRNKKQELLQYLYEVSVRDNLPAEKMLREGGIKALLASEGSPLDKAESLRRILHGRRYPEYASWLADFESLSRKIPLPRGARLDHSPHFEEKTLFLTISFGSTAEYKQSIGRLAEAAENGDFQTLCRKFCDG